MSSVEQEHRGQKIGLIPATSIVVGNLVGSGVFLLPVALAPYGSVSFLGWGLSSLGAILLSLVFGQLGAEFPGTGGPHVYARRAFGDTMGFIVAWSYWILSSISNAALVAAIMGYMMNFLGGVGMGTVLMLQIGLVMVVSGFNLFGIKVTGKAEFFIVMLKIVPLIIVPLAALPFIKVGNYSPFNGSGESLITAVNAVTFLTLWGFVGLETGTVPSGEVINPKRTIPLATILGTSIAMLVYLLGSVAISGVMTNGELRGSSAPYADVAGIAFGGNWNQVITISAIICALGSFNGWTLVVGRIALGAAEEGLFPKFLAKKTVGGAPLWGVVCSSFCTVPFLVMSLSEGLVNQFKFIVDVSITLILVVYAICTMAYLWLMKRGEMGAGVWRWVVGVMGLIFCGWTLWASPGKMVLLALGLGVVGLIIRILMKLVAFKRE